MPALQSRQVSSLRGKVTGLSAALEPDGRETDVRLAQPAAGWREYLAANVQRARDLLESPGPYQVVITFDTPITAERLRELTAMRGLHLDAYEAIGTRRGGTTLTIGGPVEPRIDLEAAFATEGASLQGIVAAEGRIATPAANRALARQRDVLIVDVGIEVVKRAFRDNATLRNLTLGTELDILQNDFYWVYSGLEE